ncbi:MAG: hypothetical protein M3295_06335, partial [Chloroflexota bacterium]|nr:hypothetical protein [Chloroflexota bacterium]
MARALRVAVIVAGIAMAGATDRVAAADPVTVTAAPRMAGHFQPGGWLAVDVSLVNSGPPVDGYVTAQSETGPVSRFVELPSGARKTVPLYVRPQPFARQVRVRLVGTGGRELAQTTVEVRALETTGGHVAIVGDDSGALRSQLAGPDALGASRLIQLTAADVPDRPEPLTGVDAVVWAGDSGSLTDPQRRAIERWIANGGELVVVGGADVESRAAAFQELLPVETTELLDDARVAELAEWAGGAAFADDVTATVSTGELHGSADVLVPLEGDDEAAGPIVSSLTVGAGRVILIGVDLSTDTFRGWEGAAQLWARLIPDTSALAAFFGVPPVEQQAFSFVGALGSIAALSVPPAELLLLVVVAYILVIGPISYVVLRRIDRRELAWVTAPVLVVVFSACSYGIGSATKGGDIIVNEIAVVRAATSGTAATVEAYAGVFSPTRASYDLRVGGDALIAALGTGNQFDPQTGAPITPTAAVEQGDPAWLRDLEVNVFGLQAVRADVIVPYRPSLAVSWHYSETGIEGGVTNDGDVALEDVAIISGNAELVGTLAAGASETFSLASPRGFQDEPASQQIYGFEDFNTAANMEERLRRQVIDGLVGQGFAPFLAMQAAPVSSGAPSGPMVIGWHEGTSPVSFEVEGKTVERHTQVIEVISGRPDYQPGPIELPPGALTTSVVAHDGDAVTDLGGGVTMSAGAADFRIALPLEVATLQPTAIEVVVGTDPGTVFAGDQFGGGFFPPGYRISVFDVAASSWVDVGDPAQNVRFELDAPARFVDRTGQMTVR